MTNLVGSIQQMVRLSRSEQEITREQLKQQAKQQDEMMELMKKLNTFFDQASKSKAK